MRMKMGAWFFVWGAAALKDNEAAPESADKNAVNREVK